MNISKQQNNPKDIENNTQQTILMTSDNLNIKSMSNSINYKPQKSNND